ncbi:MAG: hypothetical protein QF790_11010 [Gammaproteobacteria bacterium]|jgi:hypothetical protein|nr:hypothetical protein [Gammaproteobacteria bacterium]
MSKACKNYLAPRSYLFLLVAVIAAGCASNTSVHSNWHDNSVRGARFERVLVVAVADNADRRLSFEDAVAFDLTNATTRAWASARLMDTATEINAETINTVAERQDADAIVITRVKSLDVQAVEVQGRTDIHQRRQQGTLFRYDYIEREEEAYITSEYTTSLTTDVIRTGGEEPIYTVVATAAKQETLTDVIDVLSDVVAERLRHDGLIR